MKKLEINEMTAVAGGYNREALAFSSGFACGVGAVLACVPAVGMLASLAIFGPLCIVGGGLAIAG